MTIRTIDKVVRSLLFAALFTGFAASAEPPEPDGDVIIADRVRTAFLERAPRALRRQMLRALAAACMAARRAPLKDENGNVLDVAPLCDSTRLDFWREVLVTGPRLEEGWICADPDGHNDRFEYLVEDMLDDEPCVIVLYDYAERRMTVDLTLHPAGD
jgi:hypothetical protein